MRRLGTSWMATRRHRGQKGQTLMIMAFLSIFLITLLGLVVDSVRLYILSAQAERAAEAAALAGALYMPTYFNQTSPDGENAETRACEVLKQNGITTCPAIAGQVGAQVSTVAGNQYELQVTVTLQADVFFLAFVSPNLSTTMVSRTAFAEFLPPIELGSRASYFGDQADGSQAFWASVNGPSDLQEQGDAYTPTLQEGPTDPQQYPDSKNQSAYTFSRLSGSTNHQQYGQCAGCPTEPIANPDQQPSGFTGYNYQITVPAGAGNIQVQIYNPAFMYSNPINSTGDRIDIDASKDSTFGGQTDQKNEYLQMNYALYSTPLLFERNQDTLLASFQPPSIDFADSHGCGSSGWDPQGQKCFATTPTYINSWYTLYTITSPGTYRLSVNATGYYGSKNYSVRLTSPGNLTPPAGVRVFAWNNMCVYFDLSGNSGDVFFDLGEIPADYAGKTLHFRLFDPGDTSGNNDIFIHGPSGAAVQLPAWLRTTNNGTDLQASINGDRIYNGLWLDMPIVIPPSYNPTPGNDWWQIEYKATGAAPHDKLTISIGLSGSPVHLVNEIP